MNRWTGRCRIETNALHIRKFGWHVQGHPNQCMLMPEKQSRGSLEVLSNSLDLHFPGNDADGIVQHFRIRRHVKKSHPHLGRTSGGEKCASHGHKLRSLPLRSQEERPAEQDGCRMLYMGPWAHLNHPERTRKKNRTHAHTQKTIQRG